MNENEMRRMADVMSVVLFCIGCLLIQWENEFLGAQIKNCIQLSIPMDNPIRYVEFNKINEIVRKVEDNAHVN